MKGSKSWHFYPYIRPTQKQMKVAPYITRLIPMQFGFRFDYIDNGCPGEFHKVYVREKDTDEEYRLYEIPYGSGIVDGLCELCEYEFYIKSSIGNQSQRRYVRTGKEVFMADKYYDLAHHVGVLSINKDDDLMNPENWEISELFYPEDIDPYQCIEGNIVETPNGVVNLLRTMQDGHSLMMTLDTQSPEKPMYNPRRITKFPLSAVSKFEIKKDPVSGKYIAIGNDFRYDRRVLVMAVSGDLEDWEIAHVIEGDPNKFNAFSYADFFFGNDDIYLLSRTGYNGSASLHDTNMITFHKVIDFRKYL